MPKNKRLKYSQLLKRLKPYGIVVIEKRGKGSERMPYQEKTRLNYPITSHKKDHQYSIGMLKAIVRKFSLPDDFLH